MYRIYNNKTRPHNNRNQKKIYGKKQKDDSACFSYIQPTRRAPKQQNSWKPMSGPPKPSQDYKRLQKKYLKPTEQTNWKSTKRKPLYQKRHSIATSFQKSFWISKQLEILRQCPLGWLWRRGVPKAAEEWRLAWGVGGFLFGGVVFVCIF